MFLPEFHIDQSRYKEMRAIVPITKNTHLFRRNFVPLWPSVPKV